MLSPEMAPPEREKLAAGLERDISTQQLTIPFALTAQKTRSKGVGGLWMVPLLLATMKP